MLRSEAQRNQSFVLRSFQNWIEILTRKEGDQVVKGWLVSLERLREKWMDDLTSKRGRKFKMWSKDRVKWRRTLLDTVIGDLQNLIKRNDEYNKLTSSVGSKVGGIVSNLDNFVEVHGDINGEEINEKSIRDGQSQLEGKNDKNQINGKVVSENVKFLLSNNVVNLLERNFTQGEISLLSKGLKLCPTPKELNKSAIEWDLKEFGRKIKCKYHFLSNPKEQERHKFERFKEKWSWCPVVEDLSVNLYLKSLEEQVIAIEGEEKNYSNLSKEEQLALKTLKNSSDIVIKEADKGGAIVIWGRELL